MQTPFVDPGICNNAQLAFNTGIYALALYQASDLISSGSELLMLVPAVAGIVGSVVLPILGAVPDGMMVLFSGLGENAQETVSVGVGALAGSTVMLLTFPWFICILFGRAPIEKGKANYMSKDPPGCLRAGISYGESIPKNAKIMLATTFLFLVIQIPASFAELLGAKRKAQAADEHFPALLGLIACVFAFGGYLVYCFQDANEDKLLAQVVKGIDDKEITIGTALTFIKKTAASQSQRDLLNKADMTRLKKVCRPFFKRYDFDKDAQLSLPELKPLLHDLGYYPSTETLNSFYGCSVTDTDMNLCLQASMDTNHDGQVSFEEFVEYLYKFMQDETRLARAPTRGLTPYPADEDEEDDVEEAIPEDLAHLSPTQQMARVIFRSVWMMGLGTFLVLMFSDPMVDCLNEWGKRLDISPFYVSFVLAPFASNASELLAAYTYAVKKTEKNMTTSLSTLLGAACMNNTFVFSIFLALVYQQGLAWQFTAETLSMIVVQWLIGLFAISTKTQTVFTGFMILMCYPGCLMFVYFLENVVGLD
mmetsp:Transcript_15223/g.32824  ORF Transcript_15223/g.32824 Transcript_15223/m.32824 type:complete len:536 (-) Transcript_15223:249-1856(-)